MTHLQDKLTAPLQTSNFLQGMGSAYQMNEETEQMARPTNSYDPWLL
jgi:hypothetical protein